MHHFYNPVTERIYTMFFDDLETYRQAARMTKSKLATESDVSRDTITRIEKHHPSTAITLGKLVDALNTYHFNKIKQPLVEAAVITKTSRYGVDPKIDTEKQTLAVVK
jgi:DNA-binding XRE family transcriptional regulator